VPDLAPAQWDYVALGHYHVAQEVAPNAWYAGSLEYLSPNPWGQLQDEREQGRTGKCYLLVDLPHLRVTPRPITPVRRHIELPAIEGKGLTAKDLDARIAALVAAAKPSIDDQVVRLLAFDVSRATARDLDHAAIRGYKARALHFQLDLRRPPAEPVAAAAPTRRQTLPEVARSFLEHRPLAADLDRADLVRLGVEYVERAGREGEP
jgi:DNA repair protein SbcD/Mre11